MLCVLWLGLVGWVGKMLEGGKVAGGGGVCRMQQMHEMNNQMLDWVVQRDFQLGRKRPAMEGGEGGAPGGTGGELHIGKS